MVVDAFKPLAITSLLTLLATSSTAWAQSDVQDLDGVGITADVLKLDATPEETPQTLHIVGQRELENKVTRKVDDALRYTAGFVNPYGADYDTNWIRMRGFNVTTLVDGQTQFQEGYFDTTVEPFGLERIEVVSGPASSLYGDSQPGGIVNLVTKKPTNQPHHEVTLSGGTQNFIQGGLDVSDALTADRSQRYRLVATVSREDGTLDGVKGWRAYLAPSWTLDISPNTSLTLLASYLKEHKIPNNGFMPAWGTVLPRNGQWIDPSTNYGDPEHDLYDKDQVSFGWELTHHFNDNVVYNQRFTTKYSSLYLRSTAAYGSLDTATGPSTEGLYRSTLLNDGSALSFTFDNNVTGNWVQGDFSHTVVAGFDYQNHRNRWVGNGLGQAVANVDPFHPTYTGLPSDSELNVWNNQINKEQLGLYVQGQSIWNGLIQVKGGLRYDFVNLKSTNDNPDPNNIHHEDAINDGELSFNVGAMVYGPLGLQPYANYSQAFFTNASLTPIYNGQQYGYYLYEPTQTNQLELGVKYVPEWMDGYLSVAYFDLKQKNALAQTVINGMLAQSQVAQKRSQGVEVQLQAKVTRHVDVNFAYTYQDVTKPAYQDAYGQWQTGAELSPHHLASLWVNVDLTPLGLKNVTVGNGIRYLGSSVDSYYRWKVPSATLWDMNATYTYEKNWKFVLSATNLTDRRYVAGSDWNTAYYGEGRVVRASVDYTW